MGAISNIGAFPSNYVTRFINVHSMMTESKSNFPFIIINTDRSDEKGMYCWVCWIYIQKNKYFYLIVGVLKASKNLSLIMIEIYSRKYSVDKK